MAQKHSYLTRRVFVKRILQVAAAAATFLNGCTTTATAVKKKPVSCAAAGAPDTAEAAEYDYIVVGSGAGGGPLAANLARRGHKVLLLEAGDDAGGDHYLVPAFHTLASEDPTMRWDFFVQHYADRQSAHQDSKYSELHGGIYYPRAGTLGGCTAHNAMIMVYPHNSDWDHIARITGDASWSSDRMREYFQRLEDCSYVKPAVDNPGRHGFSGWLTTSLPGKDVILKVFKDRQLRELIITAIAEALKQHVGSPIQLFKSRFDPNDWRNVEKSAEGLCQVPLTTDTGKRVGSREYVRMVAKNCPDNLTVKLNALATRVILDDQNRAIGVEYLEGKRLYRAERNLPAAAEKGTKSRVLANREVILSGGAFNTPQLLMLSGIGPGQQLNKHGITTRVDLPGVGENLQDRYEVSVVTEMKKDFTLLKDIPFKSPAPGEPPDPFYAAWEQDKGIYTTNGVTVAMIKRSVDDKRSEPDLFIFGMPGYFSGYYPGYSKRATRYQNHFTWAVLKAHTRNDKGTVRLKSGDPLDVPEINFHYFDEGSDQTGEDLESVVEGVKFVRRITARMKEHIQREIVPGPAVTTQAELEQFIKANAWGHHASCSCKMGADTDPMAVVDSQFRVFGTKNLRVVDASVFPRVPGFFIVSAIYMISEKAADVLHEAAIQADLQAASGGSVVS